MCDHQGHSTMCGGLPYAAGSRVFPPLVQRQGRSNNNDVVINNRVPYRYSHSLTSHYRCIVHAKAVYANTLHGSTSTPNHRTQECQYNNWCHLRSYQIPLPSFLFSTIASARDSRPHSTTHRSWCFGSIGSRGLSRDRRNLHTQQNL